LGISFCYNKIMATQIYKATNVYSLDDDEIYITPLKIKYLREFMEAFEDVKKSKNDDEAMEHLVVCVAIGMKQYCPKLATPEIVADSFDINTIYKIIEFSASIKLKPDESEPVTKQATKEGSWEDFDLAKLESETFLLGNWKDYEDLETCLSLPELVAILEAKRDLDYQEKKFLAAIQGVDLDADKDKTNAWEEMKTRVFSKGATSDPGDILAYQGQTAAKAGFGIGMGIEYEKM